MQEDAMARTDGERPYFGPDDFKQAGGTAAQYGGALPAFYVGSDGVATPGNLVRGDGFTMRHGDIWPAYRRSRRDLN
jgi:hypothetical protein